MSYPGPPGVSKGTSHPSLPPRPPPSKLSGFKPAFPVTAPPVAYPASSAAAPGYRAAATATSYSSAPTTYSGTTVAAPVSSYGAPPSTTAPVYGAGRHSTAPTVGSGFRPAYNSYAPQQPYHQQQQQQQQQQQSSYYGAPAGGHIGNYSTAPQIRNPFPVPSAPQQGTTDYDPEMAAQIAQWQSAYMPRDSSSAPSKATNGSGPNGSAGATVGSNGAGSGGGAHASAGGYGGYPAAAAAAAAAATTTTATEAADPNATNGTGTDKKKTVYREGGGKKWQDESLLEWDPSHLRLFVGNLAGETTDESLLKAFSRWKSVQKAKVIRDKRTTKSKGFGFVSFSDPDDFFQAAKEMNGKYIQSHPVVVHKAKTEIKPTSVKDDRRNNKNHKKGGGHHEKKSGSGMGGHDGASSYEPHLGPHGGGITKPGQKTRGGLKLLG